MVSRFQPNSLDEQIEREQKLLAISRASREREEREQLAQKAKENQEKEEIERRMKAQIYEKEKQERRARLEEIELEAYKSNIQYSDEIALLIVKRISSGETLKGICSDQTMPEHSKVLEWLEDNEHTEFQKRFDVALSRRDKVWEDEIIQIADDSTNDYVEKLNKKTGESFRVLDPEALQRSKLRIDMRLRVLMMRNPDKWSANPDVASQQKKNLLNQQPNVVFNFFSKSDKPGEEAKLIIQSQASTIKMPDLIELSDDKEKVA